VGSSQVVGSVWKSSLYGDYWDGSRLLTTNEDLSQMAESLNGKSQVQMKVLCTMPDDLGSLPLQESFGKVDTSSQSTFWQECLGNADAFLQGELDDLE